jgi:hypothetical protein
MIGPAEESGTVIIGAEVAMLVLGLIGVVGGWSGG